MFCLGFSYFKTLNSGRTKQPPTSETGLTFTLGLSIVRSWAGAHHAAVFFSCWTYATSQNINIRQGHLRPWYSETKQDHNIILSKHRPNKAAPCTSQCIKPLPVLIPATTASFQLQLHPHSSLPSLQGRCTEMPSHGIAPTSWQHPI